MFSRNLNFLQSSFKPFSTFPEIHFSIFRGSLKVPGKVERETEPVSTVSNSYHHYPSLTRLGISPSYQSDLTDCSFYPPTLARCRPDSASLELVASYSQLCPCAMETAGRVIHSPSSRQ